MIKYFLLCIVLILNIWPGQEAVKPGAVAVSLCELFSNPSKFDGQGVQVDGVAVESIHTAAFIDPDCQAHHGDDTAQLTFEHLRQEDSTLLDEYWAKLQTDRAIRVEVKGIFRAGDRQYGPNGYPYQIDVLSIGKLTTLSKEYRKRHQLPTQNRYSLSKGGVLFTGKERDSESGNDYFGARYYASSMGRFMSPDPIAISPELENPQSWNKYSYTFNRPMSLTDPDGKWPGWYHTD
jgi:RHS repeat-associated protein